MDDFDGIPLHVQNILKRAGVTSVEHARSLGRDAVAKLPGVGPLALSRLFPSGDAPPRREPLTQLDLRRAVAWFEMLRDAAPARVGDGDQALAAKIARLAG